MKDKKHNIGCTVSNCTHNNKDINKCSLEEINIKCDCEDATEKEETICDSFDCNCKNEKE